MPTVDSDAPTEPCPEDVSLLPAMPVEAGGVALEDVRQECDQSDAEEQYVCRPVPGTATQYSPLPEKA